MRTVRRLRSLFRRSALLSLVRDKRGVAAVEFAAVLTPFIYLVFAICELALVQMTQASLEFAVAETQRMVRVGQAQNGAMNEAALKSALCTRMQDFMPVSCDALHMDVRTYANFASANQMDPLTSGDLNPAAFTFNMGGPDQVVLVRAFYEFDLLTPGLNNALANMNGYKRLLGASTLFRTEPFAAFP